MLSLAPVQSDYGLIGVSPVWQQEIMGRAADRLKQKRRTTSKTQKKRSGSSSAWMEEHFSDPYVKQSQRDGYRSRASYKLIELDERDQLFRPGMQVVDLGSAPGGWSQVAAARVGRKGRVLASDILAMDSIAGVTFVQGDFTEQAVLDALLRELGDQRADLVISDMAPNMSGVAAIDQPGAMYLVELAFAMAQQVLAPGGGFVAKAFQGTGFDAWVGDVSRAFNQVKLRKPAASRARSAEVYLVATGYRV